MFRELKESLKSENMDERISMKENFDIRIEEIMKVMIRIQIFTNPLST